MDDNQRVGRGSALWALAILVYLFLIANNLFTGMFAEIEDRHAYSYRPEAGAEVVGQGAAFALSAIPLVIGVGWLARHRGALAGLSAEERLILPLLVLLVAAAALRSGLALLLRAEPGGLHDVLEAAILVLQIGTSLVLVGGALRLLLHDRPAHPSNAD